MTQRASTVVRLLEELKRLSIPDQVPKELPASNGASDEHRPPKRPWEDSSRDEAGGGSSGGHRQEVLQQQFLSAFNSLTYHCCDQYSDEQKAQTTAEQDMEIIRSKRATSAAGNAPGQPKSKYRKRSVSNPIASPFPLIDITSSAQRLRASAIPVIFAKHQNGVAVQMVLVHSAMRVDFVSVLSFSLSYMLTSNLRRLCQAHAEERQSICYGSRWQNQYHYN